MTYAISGEGEGRQDRVPLIRSHLASRDALATTRARRRSGVAERRANDAFHAADACYHGPHPPGADVNKLCYDAGKQALDATPQPSYAMLTEVSLLPPVLAWPRDLSVSYNKVGHVLQAQGKLEEALKAYRDSLAIVERLAAFDSTNAQWQNDLQSSIGIVGSLAYRFVLERDFARALEVADQAISLAPNELWLYTNRAHALMFLGRVNEARSLYLQYRGQKNVQSGGSWETVVLQHFAELRLRGLRHSLMDEIEAKFTARG
jgi:tetratricopeptide (TPR) repeat protein